MKLLQQLGFTLATTQPVSSHPADSDEVVDAASSSSSSARSSDDSARAIQAAQSSSKAHDRMEQGVEMLRQCAAIPAGGRDWLTHYCLGRACVAVASSRKEGQRSLYE